MKGTIIYYNPGLIIKARLLRNKSTLAEILLWKNLKKKQLSGYDFHRQKPIDQYIVDFYCQTLNLVIEIDGASHNEKAEYDQKRQKEFTPNSLINWFVYPLSGGNLRSAGIEVRPVFIVTDICS